MLLSLIATAEKIRKPVGQGQHLPGDRDRPDHYAERSTLARKEQWDERTEVPSSLVSNGTVPYR